MQKRKTLDTQRKSCIFVDNSRRFDDGNNKTSLMAPLFLACDSMPTTASKHRGHFYKRRDYF